MDLKLGLTVAAFACDITGTILVIVDAFLARRNNARLAAVQEHITRLEIDAQKIKDMPPARPGEKVLGMDVDQMLEILQGGVEGAAVASKEVYLEISDEISKLERFPLTYIASCILLIGIALHAAAESIKE
jgi:hypothetical protein